MLIGKRIRRSVHRFSRCERGATALEFALVGSTVVMFLMGTVELALMSAGQNVLESATFQASRLGKTGFVTSGQTQSQTVIGKLTGFGSVFLDPTKITVTSLSYTSFDQVGQPEPFTDVNKNGVHDATEPYTDVNGNGKYDLDRGKTGFGTAGDIVVYTASYPWKFFTPMISTFTGATRTLTARAVVKNEPYS